MKIRTLASGQNLGVFNTLNDPNPLFQYPKTFADTLHAQKNIYTKTLLAPFENFGPQWQFKSFGL